MICNRGPKEKGMGAPPGAMPILTITSSQLLQGHYRTQSGAFVEQSNLEHQFSVLVKFAFKGQSSIPVQSCEWIHPTVE